MVKQDFSALTTFRAIGALCVIEIHAWDYLKEAWPASWLILGFELWPDYFFALSGFILVHVYNKTLFAKKDGLYNFYVYRVARVYPLHLFILCFFVGLEALKWAYYFHTNNSAAHPTFVGHTSPADILTNLFLVQAWGIRDHLSWNYPSWSVSAEFACYLLFPLLIWSKVLERKAATIALVIFSIAGLCWLQLTQHTFNLTYDLAVPRAFFTFSLGCVLYIYKEKWLEYLALIPATVLQLVPIIGVIAGYAVNAPGIYYIPMWLLLILSFTREDTVLAKALAWKPFVELGEMSYSIYMIHVAVLLPVSISKTSLPRLYQLLTSLPPAVVLVALLAITIAFSALTYRYIEKPGRAFIRRHFGRETQRS